MAGRVDVAVPGGEDHCRHYADQSDRGSGRGRDLPEGGSLGSSWTRRYGPGDVGERSRVDDQSPGTARQQHVALAAVAPQFRGLAGSGGPGALVEVVVHVGHRDQAVPIPICLAGDQSVHQGPGEGRPARLPDHLVAGEGGIRWPVTRSGRPVVGPRICAPGRGRAHSRRARARRYGNSPGSQSAVGRGRRPGAGSASRPTRRWPAGANAWCRPSRSTAGRDRPGPRGRTGRAAADPLAGGSRRSRR